MEKKDTRDRRAEKREYHKKNRARILKHMREYQRTHKKELRDAKRKWENKHKKQNKKRRQRYYKKNKIRILRKMRKYHKKYYKKNKDKIRKKHKKYDRENQTKILKRKRKYNKANRIKNRIRRRNYVSLRSKRDPIFKLARNLRIRLISAIKRNSKRGSAVRDLGCTIDFLRQYLESKFYGEMSWNNYGTYWIIDHIIPLWKFNLANRKQLLKAINYKNLQPLTAKDHMKKTAKERTEFVRVNSK